MARLNGCWQIDVIFISFAFYWPVFCGVYWRSSYIQYGKQCSLVGYNQQTYEESQIECLLTCLNAGSCAAYQWDAASGSCTMQDTFNITAHASPGAIVGAMRDADLPVTTCADASACPDGHVCEDPVCELLPPTCLKTADCSAILAANPASHSGVYYITVAETQEVKQVWCDMDTDAGGWTVFIKRLDGSVDFNRDLAAYKQGFGNAGGEYWLGLDALHAMTSAKTYQLRADVSDWEGDSTYSLHSFMSVADETSNYMLKVGTFLGGDGDAFAYNNEMMFTTWDSEHDTHATINCAKNHHGGFWFKKCSLSHPEGKYYIGGAYTNNVSNGIQWKTWSKYYYENWYSMKTVEIKLRP